MYKPDNAHVEPLNFKLWLEESQHVSDDPNLDCPDCEVFIDGQWRTGRCDDCRGSGQTDNNEGCPNCQGSGSPVCCRCEGTGRDLNRC